MWASASKALTSSRLFSKLTREMVGARIYPRSAAEITAGVTPADEGCAYGDRARYSTLADAVAVSASHPLILVDSESVAAAITLPAGATIASMTGARITSTVNGVHVFDAVAKAGIRIVGVKFRGNSASAVPLTGFGGYSAANTGLVTLANCTDARIDQCEFERFYNGVSTCGAQRVWITRNRVRDFTFCGILTSCASAFTIDRNVITECAQAGAVVAYGIQATGDEAGGTIQKQCSISFNVIDGVPSWDGIMSHDVDGIRIIGNDIRDVRQGIDVGFLISTNKVRNTIIANNYCKSTTTDTWGGAGASIGGILAAGYDATHRMEGAVIANNILDGFFVGALTAGGNPSHILVWHIDDCAVHGNVVKNGGSNGTNAGIRLDGTCNRFNVAGNILQGDFNQGSIRVAGVTADFGVLADNIMKNTTPGNGGIYVDGATAIAALVRRGNVCNGAPWTLAAGTVVLDGQELEGSATYDPPSLADGAGASTTVTVQGAELGDFAAASFGGDLLGITLTAYVSAANTVTVRFQNESAGIVDLGSSTLRVRVFKRI